MPEMFKRLSSEVLPYLIRAHLNTISARFWIMPDMIKILLRLFLVMHAIQNPIFAYRRLEKELFQPITPISSLLMNSRIRML
jgi:hypothetical protein